MAQAYVIIISRCLLTESLSKRARSRDSGKWGGRQMSINAPPPFLYFSRQLNDRTTASAPLPHAALAQRGRRGAE